jgi:hypothetical protein
MRGLITFDVAVAVALQQERACVCLRRGQMSCGSVREPNHVACMAYSGCVFAESGICCIDEFDKMSDGARAMLHEVCVAA